MIRKGWFLTLATAVALALVAVLGLGWVRSSVARSRLPERGTTIERLATCPAEVGISIDGHGIAHIRTGDEEALWFAQGFVHARDRFFQMELARRAASGRLAEVFGTAALASDRKMRTWRVSASARRQTALLDAHSKYVLDAYAAGVNAALERFGRRISPEIWLLGVEPEPWQPENSLEVALLLQLDLSWSMGEEFRRAEDLSRLGRERAAELWGWSPSEARAWIPPGDLAVSPRTDDDAIRPPLSGVGSNAWVLTPEKTATGRALLASDPHLAVRLPGPFSMIHLRGPGLHVIGASLPGTPGVLMGHNEHVAWSFTAAMLDDQDLFALTLDETGENELIDGVWLRVRTVAEEIRVRWQDDPVVLKVRLSEHGPLVRDSSSQALALSWTGRSSEGIVRAVLAVNRAVSADEAAAAWEGVIGPSLDMVAADTAGHIVQQVVGLVPDRGRGAGRLPAPGADSRWSWRGFFPMDRNPAARDPADGVLAAANHDFYAEGDEPADDRLPGDFASPWRVRRIRRMLAARSDWDVAASMELQRDVVAERAIAVLKLIRPELEAHGGPTAEILLDWDGRMADSALAPHLYSRLMLELASAVGADDLGRPEGLDFEPLVRLLAGGMSDDWWDDRSTPAPETESGVIWGALDKVDAMQLGATWGAVHQAVFDHPLGDLPVVGRLLADSWSRGPFPLAGNNVTVDATYWTRRKPFDVVAMPALRLVIDVGSWDESVAVTPLGQSGRPWSSHYADQIELWRRGGAFALPFSEAAVAGAAEATLRLLPEASSRSAGR